MFHKKGKNRFLTKSFHGFMLLGFPQKNFGGEKKCSFRGLGYCGKRITFERRVNNGTSL